MNEFLSPAEQHFVASRRRFMPIHPRVLRANTIPGVDLYALKPSGSSPQCYHAAGEELSEFFQYQLHRDEVSAIYIDAGDTEKYVQYLEGVLSSIVCDEGIALDERAAILYDTGQLLMGLLVENPQLDCANRQVKNVVEKTLHFLHTTPMSFTHLLKAASRQYQVHTHCVNVFIYSVTLAQRIGLQNHTEVCQFSMGALLHDLGKSKLTPGIVGANRSLTESEWQEMRQHPALGCALIQNWDDIDAIALDVVEHHHEKLDGTGYPAGLKGAQVSLYARIAVIADIYDALTTERTYKNAVNILPALRFMKSEFIDQLDEDLFESFASLMVVSGN